MAVEGGGDASECVESRAAPSAFLQSRNDRLSGAHSLRELALTQAGAGPQLVDQLTEREVLLDGRPLVVGRAGPLLLDVVPSGVVGYVGVLLPVEPNSPSPSALEKGIRAVEPRSARSVT
jgi:hypothetical protein